MESLWKATSKMPKFPSLDKDVTTDVLIVGGGIAGLLLAYHLQKAGVDYILVERNRVCSGVTENTTAKITLQHGLIYDKIQRKFGLNFAKKYFEINKIALERFVSLSEGIDCDFVRKDNYVYSCNDLTALQCEVDTLNKIGCEAKLCQNLDLPIYTVGAVKVSGQAQFHPLKFLSHIIGNLNLYENTFVRELAGTTAFTPKGKIKAKRIVVCTHFPFLNKHGLYFIKQYQHRSYVLALKNGPQVDGMYVDAADKGFSFRNQEEFLLLGGGDHRTGKKGGSWNELRNFAQVYYPNAQECYFWATQDCMTLDGIPYIGQYSKNTPNLFVSTGFNKWGMTSSMVSALLLTDLITGKKNPYSEVFDPSRNMITPQLFINGFESTLNLLTPSRKRCPHLGCALKWNEEEHSWDCPCHGSRFSEEGRLLNNPANDDLNVNERK